MAKKTAVAKKKSVKIGIQKSQDAVKKKAAQKKSLKKNKSVAPVKTKVKKSSAVSASIQINKKIWPMERDVLFRPDRLKYVRKLVKPEGCVFCTASQDAMSLETLCVYKSEHSMVVLNKYPL